MKTALNIQLSNNTGRLLDLLKWEYNHNKRQLDYLIACLDRIYLKHTTKREPVVLCMIDPIKQLDFCQAQIVCDYYYISDIVRQWRSKPIIVPDDFICLIVNLNEYYFCKKFFYNWVKNELEK